MDSKTQLHPLPGKTIERLSVYRRLITQGSFDNEHIYSHELADLVSGTPAQVRRDLMEVGVTGHSKRGYRISELAAGIGHVLDAPEQTPIILIGVGDLGRAVLGFLKGQQLAIRVVGAFDKDPAKIGRIIHGYRCESVDAIDNIAHSRGARVAIITTPAEGAQALCDRLVIAGIRGIANFAPTPLQVSENIWLERIDIATALEKVACLTRTTL